MNTTQRLHIERMQDPGYRESYEWVHAFYMSLPHAEWRTVMLSTDASTLVGAERAAWDQAVRDHVQALLDSKMEKVDA